MNIRLQYSELHKLPSQWAHPSETPTQARPLTVTPSVQPGAVEAEETKEQIIVPPTIALTATPFLLSKAIEQVVGSITGEEELILGLTSEDWVNLLISSLIVVLAGRAIRGFLIIIGLIGMMDRLGFYITVLLAVLGVGGLALYTKQDHPQPHICDLEGHLRLIFKPVSAVAREPGTGRK